MMDRSGKNGGRRNKGAAAPAASQCGKGTRAQATAKNQPLRFRKTRTRR
jgi:hypothetical protein